MHLNHPETIPLLSSLGKVYLSGNWSLVLKRLETPALEYLPAGGGGHPCCLCPPSHNCPCPLHSPVLRKFLAKGQKGLTLGQVLN